jgi:undecaprenyl diphosphate synthase
VLCLALSYGGRDELVDACRALAERVQAGGLDPATIDEQAIGDHLYAPSAPDVDLVIRTAGEQRLSNFLPWQAVYAEYVAAPPLWPDFSVEAYQAALREYQARDRRFGRIRE